MDGSAGEFFYLRTLLDACVVYGLGSFDASFDVSSAACARASLSVCVCACVSLSLCVRVRVCVIVCSPQVQHNPAVVGLLLTDDGALLVQ